MITPSERVLHVVEQHYMVMPTEPVAKAEQALVRALDELLASVGYCVTCWGKGFTMTTVDDTAHAVFCTCPRGITLEQLNEQQLFVPRAG